MWNTFKNIERTLFYIYVVCVTCDKLKFVRSSEKVQLQPWCVFMSELRSSREYYYRVWCQHGEQNTANFKPLNHGYTHHNRQTFGDLFGQANFLAPLGVDFHAIVTLSGAQTANHGEYFCLS